MERGHRAASSGVVGILGRCGLVGTSAAAQSRASRTSDHVAVTTGHFAANSWARAHDGE